MALPAELRQEAILGAFTRHGTYESPLAKYFPPMPNPLGANSLRYEVLEFNKAMAKMVAYGSEIPLAAPPVRKVVTFDAPSYGDRLRIPPSILKQAHDVGSLSNNEVALIAQAIQQARLNIERRLDWLRAQWLHAGQLLKSNGVVPSDGVADMVYFDSMFGKKTAPAGTALGFRTEHIKATVPASWATASTKIKDHLDAAQATIAANGGVFANRVLLNSTTYAYVMANTAYSKSEWYLTQFDQDGRIRKFWGYEWDIIDGEVPFDEESMASDTGGTGAVKMIPDNVVILTTSDNVAAGRYMVECKPWDTLAPETARGAWIFQDRKNEHPHDVSVGVEWTGAPMIANPDSTVIFKNVTSAS